MHTVNCSLSNAFILIFFLCLVSSCTTCNEQAIVPCYEAYSATIDDCQDQDCENEALDVFQDCIAFDYEFPVHIVVLTDKFTSPDYKVKAELEAIIDTLNRYFTVEDSRYPPDNREKIVAFNLKSTVFYRQASTIGGDLFDFAQPDFNFDVRHDFKDVFNTAPAASLLKADDAINVYIVDSWRTNDSTSIYEDVESSHGKSNDFHPYIVLDYKRITGDVKRTGVEEHEMGHAFGLAHVCEPDSDGSSSTNIMSSSSKYPTDGKVEYVSDDPTSKCSLGSSGLRDVGFNAEQCAVILRYSAGIADALGL